MRNRDLRTAKLDRPIFHMLLPTQVGTAPTMDSHTDNSDDGGDWSLVDEVDGLSWDTLQEAKEDLKDSARLEGTRIKQSSHAADRLVYRCSFYQNLRQGCQFCIVVRQHQNDGRWHCTVETPTHSGHDVGEAPAIRRRRTALSQWMASEAFNLVFDQHDMSDDAAQFMVDLTGQALILCQQPSDDEEDDTEGREVSLLVPRLFPAGGCEVASRLTGSPSTDCRSCIPSGGRPSGRNARPRTSTASKTGVDTLRTTPTGPDRIWRLCKAIHSSYRGDSLMSFGPPSLRLTVDQSTVKAGRVDMKRRRRQLLLRVSQ
ncbi:hypothetical protein L1887_63129 [Cichorium endivia]|nr:hypothetical protein L1887_63129 [Cichorium endivia]